MVAPLALARLPDRVDVVHGLFSRRVQHWIDLCGHALFLMPFCLLMICYLAPYLSRSVRSGEMSTNAGGPTIHFQMPDLPGPVLPRWARRRLSADELPRPLRRYRPCPSTAAAEMAASATTASFQKSRLRLRPGRPSGLNRCTAIMVRISRESSFDILRL